MHEKPTKVEVGQRFMDASRGAYVVTRADERKADIRFDAMPGDGRQDLCNCDHAAILLDRYLGPQPPISAGGPVMEADGDGDPAYCLDCGGNKTTDGRRYMCVRCSPAIRPYTDAQNALIAAWKSGARDFPRRGPAPTEGAEKSLNPSAKAAPTGSDFGSSEVPLRAWKVGDRFKWHGNLVWVVLSWDAARNVYKCIEETGIGNHEGIDFTPEEMAEHATPGGAATCDCGGSSEFTHESSCPKHFDRAARHAGAKSEPTQTTPARNDKESPLCPSCNCTILPDGKCVNCRPRIVGKYNGSDVYTDMQHRLAMDTVANGLGACLIDSEAPAKPQQLAESRRYPCSNDIDGDIPDAL